MENQPVEIRSPIATRATAFGGWVGVGVLVMTLLFLLGPLAQGGLSVTSVVIIVLMLMVITLAAGFALAASWNEVRVSVEADRLVIVTGPIPRTRRREIPAAEIEQLYCGRRRQPADCALRISGPIEVVMRTSRGRWITLTRGLPSLRDALRIERLVERTLGIGQERSRRSVGQRLEMFEGWRERVPDRDARLSESTRRRGARIVFRRSLLDMLKHRGLLLLALIGIGYLGSLTVSNGRGAWIGVVLAVVLIVGELIHRRVRVDVDDESISVHCWWRGWPWTSDIPTDSLVRLQVSSALVDPDGSRNSRPKRLYRVDAIMEWGSTLEVICGLPDRDAAFGLVMRIERALKAA